MERPQGPTRRGAVNHPVRPPRFMNYPTTRGGGRSSAARPFLPPRTHAHVRPALAPRKWRQPCRKRTTQPSSPVTLTIRHAHGGFALLTKDEAFLYSAEPGSAGKKLWQGCICIHPRPARSFPLMKMSCFQQQHPAGVAERTSPLALTGTKRPRLLGLDTW